MAVKKKNFKRENSIIVYPLLNYLTLSELNKLCKPDVKDVGTPLRLTKHTLLSKTGGPLLHSLAPRKLEHLRPVAFNRLVFCLFLPKKQPFF